MWPPSLRLLLRLRYPSLAHITLSWNEKLIERVRLCSHIGETGSTRLQNSKVHMVIECATCHRFSPSTVTRVGGRQRDNRAKKPPAPFLDDTHTEVTQVWTTSIEVCTLGIRCGNTQQMAQVWTSPSGQLYKREERSAVARLKDSVLERPGEERRLNKAIHSCSAGKPRCKS